MTNRAISFIQIFALVLGNVYDNEYAYYNFAQDMGEIFPDRSASGNGYHGTNGNDHLNDSANCIQQIHRGIYNDGDFNKYAKLPSEALTTNTFQLLRSHDTDFSIGAFIYMEDSAQGRTLFTTCSGTWHDLQVGYTPDSWWIHCATSADQTGNAGWAVWNSRPSINGWNFINLKFWYDTDRPYFEWFINGVTQGALAYWNPPADFAHTGDNPRIQMGNGWDGFISHVIIMTPGVSDMSDYFETGDWGQCGSNDWCWIDPQPTIPGNCNEVYKQYDCQEDWACTTGTQWNLSTSDWDPWADCPSLCSSCRYDYGSGDYICTDLDSSMTRIDVNGAKVWACTVSNQYMDVVFGALPSNYWKPCVWQWAACDGPTETDCLSCQDSYFMLDPAATSQTCTQDWGDDFYGDDTTRECKLWAPTCKTWVGNTASDCTSCDDSIATPSDPSGGHCIWAQGYDTASGPGLTWASCYAACETCTSADNTDCLTWWDANAAVDNGECTCNSGYYDSDGGDAITWVGCATQWATWYGTQTYECYTCAAGYLFVTLTNSWVTTCTSAYFQNGNTSCDPWYGTWQTWSGPNNTDWITWADTFATADANPGEWLCDTGYYDSVTGDGVSCVSCDGWCDGWVGAGVTNCINWAAGIFKQPPVVSSNTCLGAWPEQYWGNPVTGEWESCATPWRVWSGPEATDCHSCDDFHSSSAAPGPCECITGWYNTSVFPDVSWSRWSDECETCEIADTNCLTCASGNYIQPPIATSGQWAATCPSGTFPDAGQWKDCHATWQNWHNADANAWSSCDIANTHSLDPGPCQCSQFMYDSDPSESILWEACANECEIWNGSTYDDWQLCAVGHYMQPPADSSQQCRVSCPSQSLADVTNRACYDWHPSCLTCQTPSHDQCLSWLDPNAGMVGSPDEWKCKSSYYDSDISAAQDCQLCDIAWQDCTAGTHDDCIVCNTGYFSLPPVTLPTSCQDSCPDNYMEDGTVCTKCFDSCKTCTGTDKADCTSCMDANAISSSPSEWTCSDGYFDDDFTDTVNCIQCDPAWATCTNSGSNDCIEWTSGYYMNSFIQVCELCWEDWETCTGANNTDCLTCKDSNAVITSTGECACETNAYPVSTGPLDCDLCAVECATCDGPTKTDCLSCATGNYMQPMVDTSKECASTCPELHSPNQQTRTWDSQDSWFGDCASCTFFSNTACTTCVDPLAQPWGGAPGECRCSGAYAISTNPLDCDPCHFTWTEWYGPEATQWIECHAGAGISQNECVCSRGYYLNPNVASCSPCDLSCLTWSGPSSNQCSSCSNYGYVNADGEWAICPEGEYYDTDDGWCNACDSECATCSNKLVCLTCSNSQKELGFAGVCEYVPCADGTYRNGDNWLPWSVTWTKCSAIDLCTECSANASIANSICTCIDEYIETDTGCELDTQGPIATIKVTDDNNVLISFSEAISRDLVKDDIILYVDGDRDGGYEYTWELIEQEQGTSYLITISFAHDDIPEGTTLRVELNSELANADEYQIAETSLELELHEEESPPSEYTDQEIAEADALESASATATSAAVNSAFALGMITGDMTSGWNFVNAIQIIAFIPMFDTELPLQLTKMLKGLLDFEIIPNMFEFILDEEEFTGEKPFKRARDFGFDHAVFLINGGEMLIQTIVLLWFLPVALLFSKCKHQRIAGYFYDVIRSYKWGFFIRAWIEIYLELLLAAVIQVKSPSYNNTALKSNTILGYTFLSMLIVTPIVVPAFLWTIQAKILDPPPIFRKIYGSLFIEFKNDKGPLSSQYYSLFFLRRAIYVLNIVLLADYVWMSLSINLAWSVTNLAFLIYYTPYLSRLTNVVSIWTELGILFIFSLCGSFEYGYDDDTSRTVMWAGVSLIFAVMAINIAEMIYTQTYWFIYLWKRWKARSIVNSSKVAAMKENTQVSKIDKRLPRDPGLNTTISGDIMNTLQNEDEFVQDAIPPDEINLPNRDTLHHPNMSPTPLVVPHGWHMDRAPVRAFGKRNLPHYPRINAVAPDYVLEDQKKRYWDQKKRFKQ